MEREECLVRIPSTHENSQDRIKTLTANRLSGISGIGSYCKTRRWHASEGETKGHVTSLVLK